MKLAFTVLLLCTLALSINAQSNCGTCKLVVGFVESYLASNQTEQQIVTNLEKACSLLGPFESECDAIVEQYVPVIIKYVNDNYTPSQICTMIGLCSSKLSAPELTSGQLCTVCQLVCQLGETYLQNNATQTEIEEVLMSFPCALLPGSLETQCDAFVQQYVPAAVEWIIQNEPPSVVCAQIGLCDTTKASVLSHMNRWK
eukprot:TRINITY_DN141_c0_g1_i2.p2 TRINITY_DN141_c0_g1~~TRINITY_DN141_c0_g1_i2.p2  ORF type:complete len:200 (-),score=47.14 TRINITY_DN141_c0_g1_i2:2174-2773(-)